MINEVLESKKWGLVLNGGGGKGSYQIGVFKALRESGLDKNITAVAGSSAGSLNMCLWLFDDETCKAAWESITNEKLIDIELSMIDGYEGMVSRDGLLGIMDDFVNFEIISNSAIPLYASVSEYDSEGKGTPKARYMKLNGKSMNEIKQILLASSCLPIIYEPVEINGLKYRDGGLSDNMPIKPLYDEGIRNIIIVCTSQNMPDLSAYPDVKFMVIRPSKNIGELLTGTLNFNADDAKVRMELGYLDGMRNIRYYGNPYANMEEIEAIELRQFEAGIRADILSKRTETHLDKLKSLYDKYDF